jgi:hypothetical protein
MKSLLHHLVCRYAVSQGNLLGRYLRKVVREDYFGLFKLAIDKDTFETFTALLESIKLDEIGPECRLPAVFEYAALRGSLAVMKVLHAVGLEAGEGSSTHPLGAAISRWTY